MNTIKTLRLGQLLLKGLTVDEVAELTGLIIEDRDEKYELKKLNTEDESKCIHEWIKSAVQKNAYFCNKCGKYQ